MGYICNDRVRKIEIRAKIDKIPSCGQNGKNDNFRIRGKFKCKYCNITVILNHLMLFIRYYDCYHAILCFVVIVGQHAKIL